MSIWTAKLNGMLAGAGGVTLFKDAGYTANTFIFQQIKCYFVVPVGDRTETIHHDMLVDMIRKVLVTV